MSNLDKDWIAVAQVYATLAAAWRVNEAHHSALGVSGWKEAQVKANNLERMAEMALRAAGVEG